VNRDRSNELAVAGFELACDLVGQYIGYYLHRQVLPAVRSTMEAADVLASRVFQDANGDGEGR